MPRQDNLTETVKEQRQTEDTAIAVTVNKEETKKHGEESSIAWMHAIEIKHIESCASRSITELPRNETIHNVESNKEESICDGTIHQMKKLILHQTVIVNIQALNSNQCLN